MSQPFSEALRMLQRAATNDLVREMQAALQARNIRMVMQ